jgi:hypothetical protein
MKLTFLLASILGFAASTVMAAPAVANDGCTPGQVSAKP